MSGKINWDRARKYPHGSTVSGSDDDLSPWVVVPNEFWKQWKSNKDTLIALGYKLKKIRGTWMMRFVPRSPERPLQPPSERTALFVPQGMKASICLDCAGAVLIPEDAPHPACNCGYPKTDGAPVRGEDRGS